MRKKLNSYETYLSKVLLEQNSKIMKMKIKDMLYFNINYKESRLCYLSILWRMSIATKRSFERFSIPEHEAKLRDLINKDDPGNPNEFGCIAIAPFINGSFEKGWAFDPHSAKMNGDDICFVVFGGILYTFFITFTNNQSTAEAFIQRENKWLITAVDIKDTILDKYIRNGQKIIKKSQ